MISVLLKQVMKKCGLDQKALAEVLEVPLQRVKNLTAGNVQKLTREESAALIQKLGVRADWLITGEGSMFGDSESQDEFITRMQAINQIHLLINAMPLSEFLRDRIRAVMTGDPARDGVLIAEMILSGSQQGSASALSVRAELSPDEAALVANYRASRPEGQELIRRLAVAGAEYARSGKE